ncbi:MAG: CoA ester lyase [Gammaproteobacteria bacterium]|nr:CoA ester lyase [Gammaproteobacteria bacterium]
MSFTQYEQARARLQRSELAVPGSNPGMFEKAAKSETDYIFLDCEDAVVPDDKPQARKNIIQALNEIDWGDKTMSVRINGLDTHYMYRDVVDIVEQAGERLDTILIPKVGTPSDVYVVDCLLTQIETVKGLKKRIGIECLIETALGGANVMAIAQSSKRLEALHFGVADYAASMRARTTNIGGLNPDYNCDGAMADQWHAALVNMATACRAFGLRAIDGPFGDFNDPEGYRAAAKRVAALGYEGKWAIHPSQIALANEVMSPPEKEVTRARRILEALQEAAKAGKGAAQLDGKMIDIASERMARNVIKQADAITAKKNVKRET